MADVLPFTGVTRLDVDPDTIIKAAMGEMESVVIIGYDKDKEEYFASSIADGGTILWLLERLKLQLLLPDED